MNELDDLVKWWPKMRAVRRHEIYHRAMWPEADPNELQPIVILEVIPATHPAPAWRKASQSLQTGQAIALASAGALASLFAGASWMWIAGGIGAGALAGLALVLLPEG
jgi:hypothetical protein